MGLISALKTPVKVDLEHNDTPIGTDDWGEPYYLISKVYWEEVAGGTWDVTVTHPTTGREFAGRITPYESGSKNLPTPQRFDSYPLSVRCTIAEV